MKILPALFLCVILGGCYSYRVSERDRQARVAAYLDDVKACNALYPERVGNYHSNVICANNALLKLSRQLDIESNDVIYINNTREYLAYEVDGGQMDRERALAVFDRKVQDYFDQKRAVMQGSRGIPGYYDTPNVLTVRAGMPTGTN
ncbi:hypothetical protein [Gluconacetobacter takamatsuzukensis]|uniref:Lipoprotein n=1 Tax=Gluconacetobacter takamatsuzukensis TaxID=1286190 RepID=A0A7W4KER4_9PROT|nr:hypothetical protein [Gluconacetobacter takamatsuzukensis]MBB2205596.1 hypothetical protein [Gluconacetobacter takamatsuzukensis]